MSNHRVGSGGSTKALIGLALGALSLVGCSSASDQAKTDYASLKANNGTPRQLCAAAQKVEAASAQAGNATDQKYAQITASAECSTVDTFPQYADVPGGVTKVGGEQAAN